MPWKPPPSKRASAADPMSIKVKAPASSANLGPGFDVLGLALALHNTIDIEAGGADLELAVVGEGEGVLDRSPHENLAVTTIERFYQEALGRSRPPLRIRMENRIPLARGLGSSAATIVAALSAAAALAGEDFSRQRLFDLAVDIEGHADNVAAAVYGGLTIAYRDGDTYRVRRLDPAANIGFVALVSQTPLSTAEARAALPPDISRDAAVFNIGRVALLVEAFISGDLTAAGSALEDALHQPWRRKLITDFDEVSQVCAGVGMVGSAISGAGPTILSLYDRSEKDRLQEALPTALTDSGSTRQPVFLEVDRVGSTTSVGA